MVTGAAKQVACPRGSYCVNGHKVWTLTAHILRVGTPCFALRVSVRIPISRFGRCQIPANTMINALYFARTRHCVPPAGSAPPSAFPATPVPATARPATCALLDQSLARRLLARRDIIVRPAQRSPSHAMQAYITPTSPARTPLLVPHVQLANTLPIQAPPTAKLVPLALYPTQAHQRVPLP